MLEGDSQGPVCDAGAVLCQLSYQAKWEMDMFFSRGELRWRWKRWNSNICISYIPFPSPSAAQIQGDAPFEAFSHSKMLSDNL